MVIETSALIAILLEGSERRAFTVAIETAESRPVSAVTRLGTAIVVESRFGPAEARDLDLTLGTAGVEVAPVDVEQLRIARRAFSRYGKGRPAAGLTYGACFACALAWAFGEPLLFKGDDFGRTDVEATFHPRGR